MSVTTFNPDTCVSAGNPGAPADPPCSIVMDNKTGEAIGFTDGTGPCAVHAGWTADQVVAENQAKNIGMSQVVWFFADDGSRTLHIGWPDGPGV